jgi:hypothetical protein
VEGRVPWHNPMGVKGRPWRAASEDGRARSKRVSGAAVLLTRRVVCGGRWRDKKLKAAMRLRTGDGKGIDDGTEKVGESDVLWLGSVGAGVGLGLLVIIGD